MDNVDVSERLHSVARVADAFGSVPGNQRVLMAVLQACREPQSSEELDAIMEAGKLVEELALRHEEPAQTKAGNFKEEQP